MTQPQVHRNLQLGGPNSGKRELADLIGEVGSGIHHTPCTHLKVLATTVENRNELCLGFLRETADTCFVVVVDVTKQEEFVYELASLVELSEDLSQYSYSLLGNCFVVFTIHSDELPDLAEGRELVEREFCEILS